MVKRHSAGDSIADFKELDADDEYESDEEDNDIDELDEV